ncbi:MAG: HAD family phosphatase [Flavobacteriales bacterium]|nr:HAD family phosphatase [Flavobacteriales bacterium]
MAVNNIKNIIFDLGGVILNIDYHKTANAFKELGLTNFDELYSQFQQNNLFNDLETGNILPQEFINTIKLVLPEKTPTTEIINAWNAMLLDLPRQRIDLLSRVGRNYRIFLLSNTNKIHYEAYMAYFEKEYQLSFNDIFEKAFYSHQIGLRKPNIDSFEFVLSNSNLDKKETLFILP